MKGAYQLQRTVVRDAIHRTLTVAPTGELALIGALLADGLDCCRSGDPDACRWLERCSHRWMSWLSDEYHGTRIAAVVEQGRQVAARRGPRQKADRWQMDQIDIEDISIEGTDE